MDGDLRWTEDVSYSDMHKSTINQTEISVIR